MFEEDQDIVLPDDGEIERELVGGFIGQVGNENGYQVKILEVCCTIGNLSRQALEVCLYSTNALTFYDFYKPRTMETGFFFFF